MYSLNYHTKENMSDSETESMCELRLKYNPRGTIEDRGDSHHMSLSVNEGSLWGSSTVICVGRYTRY